MPLQPDIRSTFDQHLKAAKASFQDLDGSAQVLPGRPDTMDAKAIGTVKVSASTYQYAIYDNFCPDAAWIGLLANHLTAHPSDFPPLVLTDGADPDTRTALQRAGISYLDAQGNALLMHKGLFVLLAASPPAQGTPRKTRAAKAKGPSGDSRAFKSNGLKLIFAILTDPNLDASPDQSLLNKPYRDISATVDIALGSIGWIFSDLKGQALLAKDGKAWLLMDRKGLLDRWLPAYQDRIYPKTISRAFKSGNPDPDWWKALKPAGNSSWLWGGDSAAFLQDGFLVSNQLTLYANQVPQDLVLKGQLMPDDDGNVVIRSPFWPSSMSWVAQNGCTHPLLTYADLLASGDGRSAEAAARIYDHSLRQLIEPD